MHLGRCIARDRNRRGWLQEDLARAAGLTRRTIGNYENGRRSKPSDEIQRGYYAVAGALEWPNGGIERALAGGDPLEDVRLATVEPPAVSRAAVSQLSALELYPSVVAFARACGREGADATLRDAFEEAAERLLHSLPAGRPASSYGLAAYRPHGWDEGDPSVPEDDADRIERRLEEHARGTGA